MREIDRDIYTALKYEDEGQLSIRDRVEKNAYYLWNSKLFWKEKDGLWHFSGCGYDTNTTRCRLNALLDSFCCADLHKKNGEWIVENRGLKYIINMNDEYYFKDCELINATERKIVYPLGDRRCRDSTANIER